MSDQIPEGWTRTKFQDIAGLVKGLTYSTGDYASKDAGHPFITLKCIQKNGGFSPRGLKYYSGKYKESQIVKAGDVVFANTDLTRDGDVVGSPLLVPFIPSDKPALISMDLSKVVPKNHQNSDFIYFWLQMDEVKRQMINLSAGSTVLHLNTHDVPYLRLAAPPISEQKKIAAILSSVDEVIEKTRAQIDKLKDLKTGIMQELLTKGIGPGRVPHTEFKDSLVGRIPASWDVLAISAVCSEIVDCVNKTAPVVDYVTPYRMIRTTNVRDGRIKTEGLRYVTPETFNLWTRRLKLEAGDLIFTREAPVGECGLLQEATGLFLGQRTMVYRVNKNKMSNVFLLYSMQSEYCQSQLSDLSGGSTTPHLRVPDCRKILLKVPPISEQKLISESIRSADSLLEKQQDKIAELNSLKKALMQDLLTGKVRVQVNTRELAEA